MTQELRPKGSSIERSIIVIYNCANWLAIFDFLSHLSWSPPEQHSSVQSGMQDRGHEAGQLGAAGGGGGSIGGGGGGAAQHDGWHCGAHC